MGFRAGARVPSPGSRARPPQTSPRCFRPFRRVSDPCRPLQPEGIDPRRQLYSGDRPPLRSGGRGRRSAGDNRVGGGRSRRRAEPCGGALEVDVSVSAQGPNEIAVTVPITNRWQHGRGGERCGSGSAAPSFLSRSVWCRRERLDRKPSCCACPTARPGSAGPC